LEAEEIAVLTSSSLELANGRSPKLRHFHVEGGGQQGAGPNGHPHFMHKEIFEQPAALERALEGRLDDETGSARLEGLSLSAAELRRLPGILITGCGTSWH